MKKFLVPAALVLGLVGVAAAGAVGVKRISNGQCPLTGQAIHCLSSDSGAAQSSAAGAAVASPAAAAASQCEVGMQCDEVPQEQRCHKKRCDTTEAEKPAQKP